MLIESDKLAKRIVAQSILASDMSDDLKLFEIFKIYNDNLKEEYSQLYYALLGWKDAHLKELLAEPIDTKIIDIYGLEVKTVEDFKRYYCSGCKVRKCEGVGTKWFDVCEHRDRLKDYEKFYGE